MLKRASLVSNNRPTVFREVGKKRCRNIKARKMPELLVSHAYTVSALPACLKPDEGAGFGASSRFVEKPVRNRH
jgi:hypothetical protein